MADPLYLDSAAGNDANNGTTWALAKATLAGIDAIDAAPNTIYVAQTHSETTAAAVSYAFAGTVANPTKIICGNKAAQPPTAISTAGIVATTGNTSTITLSSAGSAFTYLYGLTFDAGQTGTGTASITVGTGNNSSTVAESCTFKLSSTGTSSRITLASNGTKNEYVNCGFRFSAGAQGLLITGGVGTVIKIKGGSVLSGGTSPTTLFPGGSSCTLDVDGFDLSNCSSSVNITNSTNANAILKLRNCKLPASWSGSLNSGTPGAGSLFEMFNCDSADTHYKYRRATQFGTMQDESTIVRSGGQSDGTTTLSYKMVSNANAKQVFPLDSMEWTHYIAAASVGSSRTLTIEFVHDSVTALKDNEIWLEAMYLGTSGAPLGTIGSEGVDVLAAGASQTSSSESWTTTGLTNPNTQKLVFTFTPQEEGYVHYRVRLGAANKTVYVDMKPTVA
jgi:hypothetical protein